MAVSRPSRARITQAPYDLGEHFDRHGDYPAMRSVRPLEGMHRGVRSLVREPTRGLEPLTTAFWAVTFRCCPMTLRSLVAQGLPSTEWFVPSRLLASMRVETHGLNHGLERMRTVGRPIPYFSITKRRNSSRSMTRPPDLAASRPGIILRERRGVSDWRTYNGIQ